MLRVNSSDVLVVPPFECAWLADESGVLKSSNACIAFEAQGDNDATVILKTKPGSRRWQHMNLSHPEGGNNLEVDHNYTVIFGSHRNTCLKIEKNSQECYRAEQAACISGNDFVSCWVQFDKGRFLLGVGRPGETPYFSWTDTDPVAGIQHAGLGSWDKHVCFRNISIRPAVEEALPPVDQQLQQTEESAVPSLTSLCQAALTSGMSKHTVCSALSMVDLLQPALDEMAPSLISYLARHLVQVLEADPYGFQDLPITLMAELLGNPCLECSEREVFEAVALWAYGGKDQASGGLLQSLADVEDLLLLIRFPLMQPAELQGLREHRLAQSSPLFADVLLEAMQARMHQSPKQRNGGSLLTVNGPRHIKALDPNCPASPSCFKRRHAPASKHLMYVSNGDGNGVGRWLGTCYGTQPWVNPMLAGMMQVQASSPTCKQTDPKALVSGSFVRYNMAGQGKQGSWWLVDLGRQHRLICNFYSLRHDGSTDYPRDWVLQGSNDGGGWVDLKEHRKDYSISMSGQSVSWPVNSHAASMPYRLFRVVLRAPNAGLIGTFHLSFFELYGHFFRIF